MTSQERLDAVKDMARSYSQHSQWDRCGYAYKLQRVDRERQTPAAWFQQGTAFHSMAEEYEKSNQTMTLEECKEHFRAEYARDINRTCEETPNFSHWFGSGPRYPAESDIERRFNIGLEQVEKYLDYRANNPHEKLWVTPDGVPAIELPFDIDLGGVRVRGYIDQVIVSPDHPPFPRDLKTGNKPGDDFQLAVYAIALKLMYGLEVTTGDFWMAKLGKPTKTYKLDGWTVEKVSEEFHRIDQGIKAEQFEPKPDVSKCGFCTVAHACPFSAA